MPPNQTPNHEKICDKFWEQANDWAAQNGFDILMKKADRIRIKRSEYETITCYKKENYMIKGWCKTLGWEQFKIGWGICSESCKYLKDIVTGTSEHDEKVFLYPFL